MRALKILVVVMGILIVVGLAVVVITIVNRTSRVAVEVPLQTAPATLAIPAGSRIAETALDGDRLLVRLQMPDGTARILVVDSATGKVLRRIDVREGG